MILSIPLGKTGEKIPVFCLGTWGIKDPEAMVKTIRFAVEIGLNHIDTAEIYGIAEETVGRAIKGIDREKVFITTKVNPRNASYSKILNIAEKSLRKLGTDYIDLYLLHWRTPSVNLEEVGDAFSRLIEQGKIRYAGVSNFEVSDLQDAMEQFKGVKVVNNQVKYNLDNFRHVEGELLPFCEEHAITLSGYSPLWQASPPFGSKGWAVLEDVAKKYGATPFQVALKFLLRTEKIFVIFKTESIDHLKENLDALKITLEEGDVKRIALAFS